MLDGEPIRAKARKDYDKALRDLDKYQREIEHFDTVDNPAFLRWFHSTFGAELTRARDINERLMRARAMVTEVQQERFFGGHRTTVDAYRKVVRRMEEERNAPPGAEESSWDESEQAREEERTFDEAKEAFRDFASALGFDVGEEDVFPPPAERERLTDKPPRMKELYRSLARRLHPDTAGELTPKEVEWWHQAQAAYDAGNLEQLELIWTLCQVQDRGTKETSVGLLGQVIAHFKGSLRALRRRLSECKRDPAWNFSRMTDRSMLQRKLKETLGLQCSALEEEAAYFERMVADWERASSTSRRGGRKASSRKYQEEEFLF